MKKYFTRFLALVCCMAATMSANAQFSATIEMYPMSGYDTKATSFKLSEVAAALETEPATLVATLDEWVNAEGEVETNYIFLGNRDSVYATNYTQGGRGQFWMDKDAKAVSWNEGSCWYNLNSWNVEADTYTIAIGQFPDTLTVGEELKAHFILAFNAKEATFDITLKVIEKPVVDIPEPVTFIAGLTLVGQQTVEVHQYARTSYDSTPFEVKLEGVAELLGTTAEVIADNLDQLLFTNTYISDNEMPLLSDSLTNASSAGGIGWWFGQLWDTEMAILGDDVARFDYNTATCCFFSESYQFNAETLTLTSNIGQMPSALSAGEQRHAHVYLIWGEKAYLINYDLIIDEREALPFEEMTEVDVIEVTVKQDPTTDYSTVPFEIDLDAVVEKLGCEAGDVMLWAAKDGGGATDAHTANRGGYWFNGDAAVCGWGASAVVAVEPEEEGKFNKFTLCQYPNALDFGQSATAVLYLIGGNNYVTIKVTLKVNANEAGPDVPQSEFHSIAEIGVNIQAVPDPDVYPIPMTFTYDGAWVAEQLGTESPTLFTDAAPSDDPEADKYSKGYTCTPYPGFWMSPDGYVTGWSGTGSPWGATFSLSDGEVTFYQYPGFAENVPGKTYKAHFYLVNTKSGAMVTFNVTLRFVSEIMAMEEVGSEKIMLTKGTTVLDLTAAIDSLGLKALDEPLDADGLLGTPSLVLLHEDGTYTEPIDATTGAYLTDKGFIDFSENNVNGAVYVYFDFNDASSIQMIVQEQNEFQLTKETPIQTKFGFQYENKCYVFNATFVDPETYTGVEAVKTQAAPAALFDLTGRRVKSAQRGIYISAGRKVLR